MATEVQTAEVDAAAEAQAAILRLWQAYKSNGDAAAKDQLLMHYVPLVKHVVRRMMPKYNSHNEYDDMISSGTIGLIDAVDKFDLAHGVKFETYAVTRIRGEILDYMRSQDWAPSSLRKKINTISATYDELEGLTGDTPSDSVVAEKLGIPVSQVQKVMSKTHAFNLVNFEDTLSSCYTSPADVSGSWEDTPENLTVNKEVKRILAEVIDELPDKERLVITLYYYEELMLKEIAEILRVSESRVSQIHSKVLSRMKGKLQKIF